MEQRLAIEDGALLAAPVWGITRRSNNWLALIWPDPLSPSGLGRRFQHRAHGAYMYLVEGLRVGDPVEFAADYTNSRGRKTWTRWYGVITGLTNEEMTVCQYDTGRQACKAAKLAKAAEALMVGATAKEEGEG